MDRSKSDFDGQIVFFLVTNENKDQTGVHFTLAL